MVKKRKKRILLILAIILFVAVLILRNILVEKQSKNKVYSSLDDFQTPKEVIEYMEGTYIKEKRSVDENFALDIYAKLKVNLYSEEISNESYYRELVKIMAYTLNFDNFRIADEEKQILIAVICDKESSSISRTYINGDDNYFANQDSNIELNKMQKIEAIQLNIESPELTQLINKNWDKNSIKIETYNELDNYMYTNNGISIKNVYKKVYNIVFGYQYSSNVINGLNTQSTFEEITKTLGEPAFGNVEEGIIGYKGTDIYVFFCYGQISVYRVDDCETTELINIIRNFNENRDVKKFVSAITDMWQDYDTYNYDTQFVNLKYSLKGLKVQFNVTSSHGLIVGSNYVGDIEELEKLKEELGLEEIYFQNIDFVYEAEKERLNNIKG